MARKCSVERVEKKTSGFATAKKNIVIQYQNLELSQEMMMEKIQQDLRDKQMDPNDVQELDVYVKPEDKKVFYVANKNITGQISL